jgi:hypothetical protein
MPMQPASNHSRDPIASKKLSSGTLAAALCAGIAACVMSAGASAQAPAKDAIPALASISFAWLAIGADWKDPPPGSGHGPIKQDPAYPFHGNLDGPGQVTIRLADTSDPVLKPWAAAQMQASNEGRSPASARCRSRPRGAAIRAASPGNCSIRRSRSGSSRLPSRCG